MTVVSSLSLIAAPLWGQEASETTRAGTIQGTVLDEDGVPVEGARVTYNSLSTENKGAATADKNGAYVSEQLPPTAYLVTASGRDMLSVQQTVTVTAGAAVTANFHLEWINPGPVRLQSHFTGDFPDDLPINGRNYLTAGELFPGVQAVDGAVLEPGKSGQQTLSIDSTLGRTTRYDFDEVESMDETKGAAEFTLPTEAVREVIVSRNFPDLFQSLNATGAVRVTTRTGGEEWHGNIFGILRDQALGLAGFSDSDDYSRQQYGFGAGGTVIKDKAFLFVSAERTKQDGLLPAQVGFPAPNGTALRSAYFRENTALARFDYNVNDNMRFFARLGFDNANLIGPQNSFSSYRNQLNVPSAAFGLDWNGPRFVRSARFGIQQMSNTVSPDLGASVIDPSAPFHMQFGSFAIGPSIAGPRQTKQRDLYARYDSNTAYIVDHIFHFGGAIHRIVQGDYWNPGAGSFGPSVTSSNGLATISAIDGNPLLTGGAEDPLNYPVGTVTIFNGLGNFSTDSAFGHLGGHSDTRLEGYFGDTFNVFPNLNLNFGVNYVYDTDRNNHDLSPVPCSDLNILVTSAPCSGSDLILNQYGFFPPFTEDVYQPLGNKVHNPYNNFAPQIGLAWDPGHSGRTVVRASAGLFYDNFLLQNAYQDRINRLTNGQFNRSLTLCPGGSTLLPNAIQQAQGGQPYITNSVDGIDIATQICGQPLGSMQTPPGGGPMVQVATAIQDLQSQFQAAQAATSGPNVYSVASLANFGGLLAPTFRTPRILHMSGGIERQMGLRSMFSVDYIRDLGTAFPIGIDSNHVGDASYLTDGTNPNPALNTYASELSAINATIANNPMTSGICPIATSAGGSSQSAVNCYLANVANASIVDFARSGLDSSNAFCGSFACSVLGKQQAAFGGINPAVGSNLMYFPGGRSQYQALHATYHTSSGVNPLRRVQRIDLALSYTVSRYRTNIAEPDGSGGDYSILTPALDYDRPHLGHFHSSGLDRTHQIVFTPTIETPRGLRISTIFLMASPLPITGYIPQENGGGVPGEIFRSDVSGDGTVGDVVNGTYIGTLGKYSSNKINNAIAFYDKYVAGQLTPAGHDLVNAGLFSTTQLHQLGAYAPLISSCNPPDPSCGVPGRAAEENWLKTIDLRLSWPFAVGERFKVEPSFTAFNLFNLANFGGPGGQLSGILDGAPGTSLNNSTSPGVCGNTTAFCTSRLDRVLPGSGTYATGAPRQMEFGVRITF
ncbi:MAG: carboxypeptidase-like regulatory domain-containing protein [Terriglobales bacterium]